MTSHDAHAAWLQRLRRDWRPMPDKPAETPENTLLALHWTAAGAPCSAVAAATRGDAPPKLDDAGLQRLSELVERRAGGVPLAHLTGRERFLGLELLAGPQALIPRVETELLAQAAIALAQESGARLAVDVCTGCGNLALALAHAIDGLQVHGADLSADSVELARRNAAMLGLAARARFHEGDLLAPFDADGFAGRVDLLVCNPPYISSGKVEAMAAEISAHEPRLAFDGGPLGVSILTRLIHEAPRYLRAGGWLAFEVGAGQGSAMARRLRNHGAWAEVRELEDGHGLVRAVLARRGTQTETME
jgi:release factor glutamine methyltransferase